MMQTQPSALHGAHVHLLPMSIEHAGGLLPHALDPEIWHFMPYGNVDSLDRLRATMHDLLERQAKGTDQCYTVWHVATDQPIGLTRYIAIDRVNYSVEIGGTWYGAAFRRTAVNTECKLLLLGHAFVAMGCQRVQIQTDVRNERSQRAIERIGAAREGIIRKNKRMPDGYERSSIMYSIINDEWPAVQNKLTGLLASAPQHADGAR